MATGSAATAKARRDAAGYFTGASSAMGQPRCGNCAACGLPALGIGRTRYDRHCDLHGAPVKTHGCCKQHVHAPKLAPGART